MFVVFHRSLHEEEYRDSENMYHYAKVGDGDALIQNPAIASRVVDCSSLSGFVPMGSNWAESEFLFSVYRTILKEPGKWTEPWIGFIQYDNTTTSKDGRRLTDFLSEALPSFGNEIVSLSPISMNYEIQFNHIAMDFNDRSKIRGDPRCYFPMIADFNRFYGTKWSYFDLIKNNSIALCSSFLMKRETFMEMMKFCSYVTSRHDLNEFDPERKHRFAGGLMERYYGTWIALSELPVSKFELGGLAKL